MLSVYCFYTKTYLSLAAYLLSTATLLMINGCAINTPLPAITPEAPPIAIPVTRYGRYTFVELAPRAAQQDLLLQVIDVSIPTKLHASVGDGLRHVLQRSGYQLCHGIEVDTLNTLPLPAAHYHLGPLVLRDALSTLVGPAWGLHINQGERQVCFRATDTLPLTETEETRP